MRVPPHAASSAGRVEESRTRASSEHPERVRRNYRGHTRHRIAASPWRPEEEEEEEEPPEACPQISEVAVAAGSESAAGQLSGVPPWE